MARKQKNNKRDPQSKLDRQLMIAKIILAITPIIVYMYVSLASVMMKVPFQELLETQPSLTIIFIIAMLNPYVAYLLGLAQKKIKANEHGYALTNMIFLIIAQALTMNPFYFIMLLFLCYRMVNVYQVDVKETLRSLNVKKSLVMGGGGLIVVFMSAICLFATLRIM